MRITHEDFDAASESFHEIMLHMQNSEPRFFEEMCENMDIDAEAAVHTLETIWESTKDGTQAIGYTFFIAIIAARKAIGREAEVD